MDDVTQFMEPNVEEFDLVEEHEAVEDSARRSPIRRGVRAVGLPRIRPAVVPYRLVLIRPEVPGMTSPAERLTNRPLDAALQILPRKVRGFEIVPAQNGTFHQHRQKGFDRFSHGRVVVRGVYVAEFNAIVVLREELETIDSVRNDVSRGQTC